MQNPLEHYREMYRIRCFEQKIMDEFSTGIFSGTTHTYLGQEANAVGVISNLQEEDIIFSNHRCHGHFLAYGGDMQSLYAELMGKPSGVGAGRGGSQHIHWKNFFSNGIQGSGVPIGTGTALAEKLKGNRAITIIFLGDGTMGQGVIYEAFNMSSLWGAPVLYIVENNHIAQTTITSNALAGKMSARFEAFDIPGVELDTSDVLEISTTAKTMIDDVRNNQHPQALILHTQRFGPHSKGDDTRQVEDVELLKSNRDPIKITSENIPPNKLLSLQQEIEEQVDQAFSLALAAPTFMGEA